MPERGATLPLPAGQNSAILAILIGLADPGIRGVLVSGHNGTGKSALLGQARRLCRENTVEVPFGTALENLLGSTDYGVLLAEGREVFRKGLLERAAGGLLIVDDLFQMPEVIAGEILCGPFSGSYRVFASSGLNSESIRPAQADRFDLAVTMEPLRTAGGRLDALLAHFGSSQGESGIESLLDGTRSCLEKMRLPSWLVPAAAVAATGLKLDGQRGEIALVRASIALAALRRETVVDESHVLKVAPLALCHRTRNDGQEAPPTASEAASAVKSAVAAVRDGLRTTAQATIDDLSALILEAARNAFAASAEEPGEGARRKDHFDPVPATGGFPPRLSQKLENAILRFSSKSGTRSSVGSSRRMRISKPSGFGRSYRLIATDRPEGMDPVQTAKVAVLHGMKPPLLPLSREYWRRWEKHQKPSVVAMLVIDASRSSAGYLVGLGATVESLFERVLDRNSKIGLVTIESGRPVLVFAPTRNRLRVLGKLGELAPSGETPLADTLLLAGRELAKAGSAGSARGFVLLVSDCYPEPFPPGDPWKSTAYEASRNAGVVLGRMGFPIVVVDPMSFIAGYIEKSPGRRLGRYLAGVSGGELVSIPSLKLSNPGRSLASICGFEKRDPDSKAVLDKASAELLSVLEQLSGMS